MLHVTSFAALLRDMPSKSIAHAIQYISALLRCGIWQSVSQNLAGFAAEKNVIGLC